MHTYLIGSVGDAFEHEEHVSDDVFEFVKMTQPFDLGFLEIAKISGILTNYTNCPLLNSKISFFEPKE